MAERIARIARPLSWRHQFIRDHDYRCHYCNRFAGSVDVGPDGKPWHVDHMNALAAGGEDVEENLTLACERCNSLKYTLPYANFKEYAATLFWASEPRRISDDDLSQLMAAFLRTTDGEWFYTEAADAGMVRLHSLAKQELGVEFDGPIAEIDIRGSTSKPSRSNADFIVLAHRLMPQLVAEVHLLRNELQATKSAA
jgi:hypothetical protein